MAVLRLTIINLMEMTMHYLPHGFAVFLGGTCLATILTSAQLW